MIKFEHIEVTDLNLDDCDTIFKVDHEFIASPLTGDIDVNELLNYRLYIVHSKFSLNDVVAYWNSSIAPNARELNTRRICTVGSRG